MIRLPPVPISPTRQLPLPSLKLRDSTLIKLAPGALYPGIGGAFSPLSSGAEPFWMLPVTDRMYVISGGGAGAVDNLGSLIALILKDSAATPGCYGTEL